MSSSQTVIGIFETKEQARAAADHLASQGFDKDTIDLSAHGKDLTDTDHDRTDTFFTNLLGRDDTSSISYREAARRGTVLTVHTTEMRNAERAAAIMDEHGAINVGDKNQTRATSGTTHTGTAGTDRNRDLDLTNKDRSIPVIEENVQVGKKEVTTGGVRLNSRIIEKPVEKTMRLREEHVHVDRKPVDRPASQRDMDTFKAGEAKVIEHAEVPLVKKEARVVEEVRVGKETTAHNETIRETAHKTDVQVDKINPDKPLDRDRNLDSDRDSDRFRNS
ncbi:YsnF/AvaK domain-containing protein [Cesiribacter andamanensis]|uniref:DUF2382 domain-containing protein n=1 Tax=Cesiribacter andamanensis AMV16 TaxID=1279009 RepID=M7NGJ6_9BACT|nr:YsnF/AvaK domain-containing protein [Cesiribacter andamanensis]EMR00960.1 hypothetical protein ADICEAN_03919 [Cesiribacter andamanensis AMV16]